MEEILVGDKFYKESDMGDLEIIRIIRKKNDELYMAIDDSQEYNDKNKFRIEKYKLKNYYTKIIPDGYFSASIVSLDKNFKDVIVSLHRTKDLENNSSLPYAACRQNIFDLFANQILRTMKRYVGLSMNQDNCPNDVDFNIVLACNGVDFTSQLSIYLNDTLSDILFLLQNKTRFNDILKNIKNSNTNKSFIGYHESLDKLLIDNQFMYDFHYGFNILEVNFEVKIDEEDRIEYEQKIKLEDIIKYEILNNSCIEYSHELILDKIKRNYQLICDSENKIYALVFDKGEYINRPYDKLHDKGELLLLKKYVH